jgi:DNA-binding transcriptional LysR family regulator
MPPASNVPDLTARQLSAVLAVAEYGSFIAAAALLNTSQPALTRTIKRVEQVLGVALFERSTRRVHITAAGREFIAVAERMLNDLRITVRSMREIADEQRGQVIVSSIMSVANGALPRIAGLYRQDRPGIELHVREGVHGTVLEDVRSGVADFGISYVDDLPDTIEAIPLGVEAFKVVLPRAHPLAARRTLALAALNGAPLVSLPNDSRTRRIIDAAAATAGITLRHAVTVTQFATTMSFVRSGVGLAIVPGSVTGDLSHLGLAARPLTAPALRRELGAILLRGRPLSPAAAGLMALVRKRFRLGH